MRSLLVRTALGLLFLGTTREGVTGNVTAEKVGSFDVAYPETEVAISPDGRLVATISIDVTSGVDVYDVGSHRLVMHADLPTAHTGGQALDFDPSGEELAVCGDFTIAIYSTKDWSQRKIGSSGCESIAFTPDGHRLAALFDGSKEDPVTFRTYDSVSLELRSQLITWVPEGNAATSVKNSCSPRFVKDDDMVFVDGDPKIAFEATTFALTPDNDVVILQGHLSKPCSGDFQARSRRDPAFLTVNLHEHRLVQVRRGFQGLPSWSLDGRYFAYSDDRVTENDTQDGVVEAVVVDAKTGAIASARDLGKTSRKLGHGYSVHSIRFSSDGEKLFVWTSDGLEIWDNSLTKRSQRLAFGAIAAAFSSNGKFMAVSGEPSTFAGMFGTLAELVVHPHGVGGRVVVLQLNN